MENGVLSLTMKSPLYAHAHVPNRRMALDSLLAGMLYARSGDGPGAVASLRQILAHWKAGDDHIPQASQIIFSDTDVQGETTHTIHRSPLRYLEDPVLRAAIVGFKADNALDTMIRPYKSAMTNSYTGIEAGVVFFLVRGDLGRIEEIVRRAGRIGALRAKGGGEIDRLAIDAVPAKNRMFGIVCADMLMRPIPARLERELLSKHDRVLYRKGGVEAWRAPCHVAENKEPCLVPVQNGTNMILSLTAIRSLLV